MSDSEERAVEGKIDALYQAPLDRFTNDRNALAAELRKGGQRDEAERVKALTKPGVTAWAVNQVWWRDPARFRAMLDAGAAQRDAHLQLLHGKTADVRAAAETRQRSVEAVVDAAVDALGGPDSVAPDTRYRIAGTIEAFASGGVPEDVTIGRLVKDLQLSGLEALSALAGIAPATAPPKSTPPPRPVIVSRSEPSPDKSSSGKSSREAREEAKAEAALRQRAMRIDTATARLHERESALRAAKTEAAETEAAEKKARAVLDTATDRVADLERKLEEAQEQERGARRTLTQATKAASEAEMIRARTVRDVDAAREQLATLESS